MNKDIFRYTKTLKIYHPQILSGEKRSIFLTEENEYKKIKWFTRNCNEKKKTQKIVKYIVNSK